MQIICIGEQLCNLQRLILTVSATILLSVITARRRYA